MKPARHAETWRPMTVGIMAALIAGCGGPEPDPADRSLGPFAADIAVTVQQTLVAADVFFGFASPVDTRGTPEEVASAVKQRLDGLRAGCGSVTGPVALGQGALPGQKVTADFGAPPGCTLGARQISGSTTVSIQTGAMGPGVLSLGISFVSTAVDGSELRGGVNFTPATQTAILGSQVPSPASVMLRVVSDRGKLTLTTMGPGSAPVLASSVLYQLTLSDVLLDLELCYPVAGTLQLSQSVEAFGCMYGCNPRGVTLAFTDASATTGDVQASSEGGTWSQALPPYGGCPRKRTVTVTLRSSRQRRALKGACAGLNRQAAKRANVKVG